MGKQVDFEISSELKRLFNQEFDAWCARTRLGLEELSARCGVSRSYLAHIGRYGRIPSKPVLLLLALNFGMKDPTVFLHAARIGEPWPFERGVGIGTLETPSSGFLSLKLDMDGFVDAIRGVVREQVRPKTIREFLAGRPLTIGLNAIHPWMFGSDGHSAVDYSRGLIPELCSLLGNSLGCSVATTVIPYQRYVEALRQGEIDLFGPMLSIPEGLAKAFFSIPIQSLGLSALFRMRPTAGLGELAPPSQFDDLRNRDYSIAVVRNSRAHLIANMRLNRPDESLVICETVDEAIDRLLVRGVAKPAHIFICTTITAYRYARQQPSEVQPLFDTPSTLIELSDQSFAIRPDWGEVVPMINQALHFVLNAGGFAKKAYDLASQHLPPTHTPPKHSSSQLENFLGMVG